jgi:hypothetical protein
MTEIDHPDALSAYYRLLLSVLRIIVSIIISCGPQNPRTMQEARKFLAENRLSMVTIFKRQAKIGSTQADASGIIADLVKHYVLLITATDFLNVSAPTSSTGMYVMGFGRFLTLKIVRGGDSTGEAIYRRLHLTRDC